MRVILIAIGAAVLAVSPDGVRAAPAPAQTAAPAPAQAAGAADAASAEEATPEKEALVRRYFKAIDFEHLIDTMMAATIPTLVERAASEHPEITPAEKAEVGRIVRETMREEYVPKLLARVVPIYARSFSRADLEAIVTFYESPAGRAVTAKAPGLTPQVVAVSQDLLPAFRAEIVRRICDEFGCGRPADKKSSKS